MSKIMRSVMRYGWLIVFGVSCQGLYTTTPLPSATLDLPRNWWTLWLTDPVCKPSCWHNITPGVTTKDEALKILEAASELTITHQSKNAIEWKFNKNEEIGWLNLSESGKVAWLLNTSDETLLLENVIDAYGNPQFINPFDCREGMCDTALVYPEIGVFLTVFIKNTGANSQPQFEIQPDTTIYRVYFMEPGAQSSLSAPMDVEILMDWKGYGTYN